LLIVGKASEPPVKLIRHSGLDPWFDIHTTLSNVEGESSFFGMFSYWMPVDDPVFSGDQVRHDGQQVNININDLLKGITVPSPLTGEG
jgi:hypothetical protein